MKIFLGAEAIDAYAAFLRTMGEPLFPYRHREPLVVHGAPRHPAHETA